MSAEIQASRHTVGATNLCPIWTPLHIHRQRLFEYISGKLPSIFSLCQRSTATVELKILDVGCGTMPYRSLFAGRTEVESYEGADIDSGNSPSVKIDPISERILVEDSSYDLVISFQALEHVPRPDRLIAECRRVLRPGGVFFCTVPFIFEYHAVPGDYHRWTVDGLAYDLGRAGFGGVRAEAVESDWESLMSVTQFLMARKIGYVVGKPFFLALNILALVPVRLAPGLCPLTVGGWGTKLT